MELNELDHYYYVFLCMYDEMEKKKRKRNVPSYMYLQWNSFNVK